MPYGILFSLFITQEVWSFKIDLRSPELSIFFCPNWKPPRVLPRCHQCKCWDTGSLHWNKYFYHPPLSPPWTCLSDAVVLAKEVVFPPLPTGPSWRPEEVMRLRLWTEVWLTSPSAKLRWSPGGRASREKSSPPPALSWLLSDQLTSNPPEHFYQLRHQAESLTNDTAVVLRQAGVEDPNSANEFLSKSSSLEI